MEERLHFSYEVDSEDRVAAVKGSWLDFGGSSSVAKSGDEVSDEVVGKMIWEFIAEGEPKQFFERIFFFVRVERVPANVPFRADAPDRRRFMELHIQPLGQSRLGLDGFLLNEDERPTLRLLDPSCERSERTLSICSLCKKVGAPGGGWCEAEQVAEQLSLSSADSQPRLSHVVCPGCLSLYEQGFFWA